MANSTTGQGTATTSATKVTDGDQNAPSSIFLKNLDAAILVYWGYSSTITSSTGVPLAAGASIDIPADAGDAVYIVAASGTPAYAWARTRNLQRNG